MDIKKIIEELVDTFLKAGELSISLRDKGLKKEIKSDNTPVSNGDIEVNKFITKKIWSGIKNQTFKETQCKDKAGQKKSDLT